ncbi:uncharacterized protein LOC125299187 isoform X3 [Alosa alosa]|uniref:uncharacterized protein LOC125299187 isoform X3 n=1 Tax=Alosa alosa TaxID=278164 RepID=UPI002015113C|nr:uncharacterized protein LOC125299187 isoform X3 [Alosa alosa]
MEMSAKLCVLMVLLIFSDCARKAGVKGDVTPTVFSSAGGHITLPCNNVLDEGCFSTTWIYNSAGHDGTIEEVGHGQVKQDSPTNRSKRLMVESDCSLNITDVTTEDAGLYTCQQFPKEGGQKEGGDAPVYLAVLQNSKSTSAFPTILASTSTCETITDSTTTPSLILKDHTGLNLPKELLTTFYSAIIQSVICTSITVWFGSATKRDRARLQRTIRAERIIGADLPSIQDLYRSRVRKRAAKISADPSHPGHKLFNLLPSGRRYRALFTKTSRHKDSFFPQAATLLNAEKQPPPLH